MGSNLWTEKYRPKTFDEMRGQTHIVKRVKALVESQNLPHLMLVGPPGIGKTTLSLVIANELFGDRKTHNYLELNSSDERGIDVIRNKVKDFARTKAIIDVPFKVIFLDECDALTRDAQQALRRTMESYSSSCRFVLSCNYGSKIIDPIKSRCTIFKFKPLEEKELKELIVDIAKSESLTIEEDAIERIAKISAGDVRQMENILQSCASLTEKITVDVVEEVVSSAEPEGLKEALEIAVTGDFIAARSRLLDAVLNNGLSGLDVIKLIQKEVWTLKLDDKAKLNLIERCGETEFRIVEGADDFVQLEALLASFVLARV